MAGKNAKPTAVDVRQLGHLKKLRHLLPLLAELRDSGCERDRAHNRQLHFDQYVTLVLLYLFNPLIDSMRVLQEAAAVDKIARQLGVGRFSLGSFSESVRCFEPRQLKKVIAQLAGELKPLQSDPRITQHLSHVLTVADGTVLDALVKVTEAFWLPLIDGCSWTAKIRFRDSYFRRAPRADRKPDPLRPAFSASSLADRTGLDGLSIAPFNDDQRCGSFLHPPLSIGTDIGIGAVTGHILHVAQPLV
jgi:hypothetical protein